MDTYRYKIILTVNGTEIDLDALRYFIPLTIRGDKLDVTGDNAHATISFETNEPWRVMEYCATVGEMHDITVRNLNLEA